MSDQRYQPPSAPLTDERRLRHEGTGSFEIGRCLSEGWDATWASFPLWLGVGIAFVLVNAIAMITILGLFLVVPVLLWGGTLFVLRVVDGEAAFGDLFEGFSDYPDRVLRSLGLVVGFFLLSLVGSAPQLFGTFGQDPGLIRFGTAWSLIWSWGVMIRFYFSFFYLVDRDLGPIEALGASWRATRGQWLKTIVLMILGFVITLAGAFVLLVGMVPALMIFYAMWASAYRQMEGHPGTAGPA